MSLTNFQKVQQFNKTFSVERLQSFTNETFDNKSLMDLRMGLIREEMKELEEAVSNRDRKETIDALTDILYVVYGMGDCLGINLDKSFEIVHNSNMSKICETEEQAISTVMKYREDENSPYDSPTYRKLSDTQWLVFNHSTGKVLKNKDYKQADFSEMLQ